MVKIDKGVIRQRNTGVPVLLDKIRTLGRIPSVVGIDLSGSQERPTGICLLSGNTARLSTAFTDKEIIERTLSLSPSVVSIDSPLSLPKGRTCTRDNCRCRRFGITREIERILKRRGINVYPCLIKSMQGLTKRGMALSTRLKRKHKFVIESYPGAAQDILGFTRKRVDLMDLKGDLMNTGIIPQSVSEVVSHHELDALTSALVGYFYLADQYEAIGRKGEGYLIIPRVASEQDAPRIPKAEGLPPTNEMVTVSS